MTSAPISGSVAQPFSGSGTGTPIANSTYVEGEIYKASGKFEASGLPLMLLGGALAGIVTGVVYYYISQFIDLIILFPIAAGFCVGALISMGVKTGKVRSPRMAGTVGVLGGILLVCVMQLMGAFSLRGLMVSEFTEASLPTSIVGKDGKPHQPSEAELAPIRAETFKDIDSKLTPLKTVVVYEHLKGEAGSSIKGMKIEGGWFWALEAFEALLLIATAGAVAAGAASNPFCENCDVWHDKQDILRVHPMQNPTLWEKVAAKDWKGLMDTPVGGMTDSKNLTTISLTNCPKCNCGTLNATSAGGSVPAEILHMQLSPETSRTLLAASVASVAGTGSA